MKQRNGEQKRAPSTARVCSPLRERATLAHCLPAHDLQPGHVLKRADIAVRSPGDGMPPHLLDQVVGRRLRHGLKRDDDISLAEAGPARR